MNKYELTLTNREKQVLKWHTPKQVERYFMQKFVHQYSFFHSTDHEKLKLKECLNELNKYLEAEGYKPKKATATVSRLLNQPLISYDIDQDYYGGI